MPHVHQRLIERPCPYCKGREVTKAGKRYNRSLAVQLYKCNHCTRKFCDRATHNTTYPIPAIIETLSLYNRGYTLDESARRAGKRHRLSIRRQTAGSWKERYAKHFPYLKIRDAIASTYAPHSLIMESRLHHGQVYDFAYHRGKMQHILAGSAKARAFHPLKTFLESAPTETPHDLFRQQKSRASQTKERFSLNEVAITERKNSAVDMAAFVIPTVSRNTMRHPKLQDFMLTNDLATVAVEVPVYLTHEDTEHFTKKLGFALPFTLEKGATITGHIDLLQIRGGMIHILDYKPKAKKEKPVEQLMVYALALSRRTGLRLYHFKCAWFDDVGGCVNPHLNGGEIPWGSVATSWRKLYEWLSVPQGASLVSSGLLLDPQTAISIQGRQELATHSSLLLAQIQKYTIPQNALRHLSAGFRRHLQTMSTTMSSTRSTSCTREKSDPPRKRGIAFFSVT